MDKKTYKIGVDGAYRRSDLRVITALGTMMLIRTLVVAERNTHLKSRIYCIGGSISGLLPQTQDGPTD